ncbi:uncharacterized protein METZ01_LOCUS460838, partial [marine metagenome]
MEVKHYSNSFIIVKSQETILFCDPWVGTANYGGWLSYPLVSLKGDPIDFKECTAIYISHLHEDHFCPRILENHFNKNIPIYIKKFTDRRLYKKLIHLGHKNVLELEDWSSKKISEEMEITIIPPDIT